MIMKKIISFFILICFGYAARAQHWVKVYSYNEYLGLTADSVLVPPKDTLNSAGSGSLAIKNGHVYQKLSTGSWSQIDGGGNAVQSLTGSQSIQYGAFNSMPSPGTPGRFYAATDSSRWYFDNGMAWINLSGSGGGGGGSLLTFGIGIKPGSYNGSSAVTINADTIAMTTRNSLDSGLATKQTTTLSPGDVWIGNGSGVAQQFSVTGDFSFSSSGVGTINANAVTLAKQAQAPANTIPGNNTGSTANLSYLTVSQVVTMLNVITNQSGVTFLGAGAYSSMPSASTGSGLYYTTDSLTWYYSNGTTWTKSAFNLFFHNSGARGDSLALVLSSSMVAFPKFVDSVGLCLHHKVNGDSTWTWYLDTTCVVSWAHLGKVRDSLAALMVVNGGASSKIITGILSSRPSASACSGCYYGSTTDSTWYYSNGTAWSPMGKGSASGGGGSGLAALNTAPYLGPSPKLSNDSLYFDTARYSHIFSVVDYGAYPDGVDTTGGSITSGANTVTCAVCSFSASSVGKYIMIYGAGASGAPMADTIVSYLGSNQVTVQHNAGTTVSGAEIVYGTDATAGIQAAITNCWRAGGGTVWLPAGGNPLSIYLLTRPLVAVDQNGDSVNSQLYIPDTAVTSGFRSAIRICGEKIQNVTPISGPLVSWGRNRAGVMIKSMITGSGEIPALVASGRNAGGYQNVGVTDVYYEGINFSVFTNQGKSAPTLGAVNGTYASKISAKRCSMSIDAPIQVSQDPSAYETFGIISGRHNDNGPNVVDECNISGFKYGIVAGEHTVLNANFVYDNKYGLVLPDADYGVIGNTILHWNSYQIYSPYSFPNFLSGLNQIGNNALDLHTEIETLNSSQQGSAWYGGYGNPVILDSGNYIHGIVWAKATISPGTDLSLWMPVYNAQNLVVKPYYENSFQISGRKLFNMTYNGLRTMYGSTWANIGIGSMRLQGFQLNNGILGDNAYFNGTAFVYDSTGYASWLQLYNGAIGIRNGGSSTGTAGSSIVVKTPFSINNDGSFGIGGNGSFAGSTGFTINGNATGQVGIGNSPNVNEGLNLPTGSSSVSPLLWNSATLRTTLAAGQMQFQNGLWFGDSSASKRDTFAMRSWAQANFAPIGTSGSTPNIATILNSGAQSANATWTLGGKTFAFSGMSHDSTNTYGPVVGMKDSSNTRSVSWANAAAEIQPFLSSSASSGQYTPVLTNVTNVSVSSNDTANYTRIGNIVTVYGSISFTATSGASSSTIYIPLPVASLLNGGHSCWGTGSISATTNGYPALSIFSSPSHSASLFIPPTGDTISHTIYYSFSYQVQ